MKPLQSSGEESTKSKNPFHQWTEIGNFGTVIKKCLKNTKISEKKLARGTSTTSNSWDGYSTGTVYRPEMVTFSQLICSSNSTPDYNMGIKFDLNAGNLLQLFVTSPCIFLAFLAGCGAAMFYLNRAGAARKVENENVESGQEAEEENGEMENVEQVNIPIKKDEPSLSGNGLVQDGNQNKAPFQTAVKRMIAIFLYQLQRHGSNESDTMMRDEGLTNAVGGIEEQKLGRAGEILRTIPEEINVESQKYMDMKEKMYKDKIIWHEAEEHPDNSEV